MRLKGMFGLVVVLAALLPAMGDAQSEGIRYSSLRPGYFSGTTTLTEGSATGLVTFSIAAGQYVAGTLNLAILCRDAGNFVTFKGSYALVGVNAGGTESCAIGSASVTTQVGSGGASIAAAVPACDTSPTNAITYTIAATCSLTQTFLEGRWTAEMLVSQGTP